jgi:uroporphyrin-III C-methyltransferase/precorrin-2 dehydrogenase/sirohydrochlorin ferrochelatase
MRFLPVFMDVTSGPVALVGASEHAVNKLRLLLAAHATVRWFPGHTDVADEIVQAASAPGRLEVDFHDPLSVHLADAIAVVSATGDSRDETIAARARAAGIPVNVVDRAELSTFVFPAIVDRGEVVVAIGTGGLAPVLARRLRERIEAIVPARIGDLAALMGSYRRRSSGRRSSMVRSARRCSPAVSLAPRPISCAASTMAAAAIRRARPAPCSWSAPARAIPIC